MVKTSPYGNGNLNPQLNESRVHDLAGLKMGMRVNQKGVVQWDYHTVMDSIKSSGSKGDTVAQRQRYYVAHADYLVELESAERGLLETLDAALQSPTWQSLLWAQKFCAKLSGAGGNSGWAFS